MTLQQDNSRHVNVLVVIYLAIFHYIIYTVSQPFAKRLLIFILSNLRVRNTDVVACALISYFLFDFLIPF